MTPFCQLGNAKYKSCVIINLWSFISDFTHGDVEAVKVGVFVMFMLFKYMY